MKHPEYKLGTLSYEIEQAMRQYIASYTVITHAQNTKPSMLHIAKANSNPKIYSFKQDIFKGLVNSQLYAEVPQFILRKHLENAIAALRGTDNRTINKWLNDLEK